MNITLLKFRYAQLLVIFLLGVFLYIMSQSVPGDIDRFKTNLWNSHLLITSFTRLRLKLGDRVFSQVLVGKEGWLDFTKNHNLDGYQNAVQIRPKEIESTQSNLQKLYEELRKRNITLLLIIPPNKATIYPDKLPDEIQKLHPHSKLDEFAAYIKQHGPPVLLDLRPALQDARKRQNEYDVYYKTDTHWNSYGAFIAYREIMKALSKNYPQLTPKNISDFNITLSRPHPQDLAYIMGAIHLFEPDINFKLKKSSNVRWTVFNDDEIVPLQMATTPNTNLPTLLMYMDSFGVRLKEFVAPHFKKTTFIFNASSYRELVSLHTIDIIQPDIVIIEMVERSFNSDPNLDGLLKHILSEK